MVLQGLIEDMSEEIGMIAINERGIINSINSAGARVRRTWQQHAPPSALTRPAPFHFYPRHSSLAIRVQPK